LEDSISNYDRAKFFGEKTEEQLASEDVEYRERVIYHKVKKRDTWYSVAKLYGVSISQLKSWNPNSRRYQKLKIGDLLAVKQKEAYKKEIKAPADSISTATQTEKSIVASDNQALNSQQTAEAIKKKADGQKLKQTVVNHKVKSGDTITKIARKYGVSVEQICKLNNMTLKTASKIRVGQTIRIK